jgi:hypothetical protein
MADLINPQNVIGAIMTGILGILWYDLRKFRKDVLTEDKHELLCTNKQLETQIKVTEEIKQMKREVISEIRKVNNKNTV